MDNEKERINGLITRIKSDDKSAIDEFYKLTSPKAYFIALKITQNEHDAEDILQESYMKALEKLDEIIENYPEETKTETEVPTQPEEN